MFFLVFWLTPSQVVGSSWGDEGPDWHVGDWRDTISIPAPGNVTVRWRADDFTGEGEYNDIPYLTLDPVRNCTLFLWDKRVKLLRNMSPKLSAL